MQGMKPHEATWSHELVTLASRFRGMISRKGLIATARRYEEVFVGDDGDEFDIYFFTFYVGRDDFFSRWKRRPPTKPSTMIRSQTKMRVKVWPSPEFGSEISWSSRHFSEFPSLDSQFQGFPSGVEIFSGIWMDIKSGSKMDLTI